MHFAFALPCLTSNLLFRYPVGRVQIFLVAQVSGRLGHIDVGVGGLPMGSTLNSTWGTAFVGSAAATSCSSPSTPCIRTRCGSYMAACPLSTSASSGKKPLVSSITVEASVRIFVCVARIQIFLKSLQTFTSSIDKWVGSQDIWMHVCNIRHSCHRFSMFDVMQLQSGPSKLHAVTVAFATPNPTE